MKVSIFKGKILSFLDIFQIFESNKCVLLINQGAFSIFSAAFIMRSSECLSDRMQALTQMLFFFAVTGVFICIVLQMKHIERLHNQLQDISTDGKHS